MIATKIIKGFSPQTVSHVLCIAEHILIWTLDDGNAQPNDDECQWSCTIKNKLADRVAPRRNSNGCDGRKMKSTRSRCWSEWKSSEIPQRNGCVRCQRSDEKHPAHDRISMRSKPNKTMRNFQLVQMMCLWLILNFVYALAWVTLPLIRSIPFKCCEYGTKKWERERDSALI